jgi:GNAT acetyltransferase-like protein
MSMVIETAAATTSRLRMRDELTHDDLAEMYALLATYFDGVTPAQFNRDIAQKNWIVSIERGGQLVGFSTILAYETRFEGEEISVIYSGDTIVAPEAWSTAALPNAWIECVAMLRSIYPRGPYIWLLLTSGFRTYRFLPVFWREFFPRHELVTPARQSRLIHHLAMERFGSLYDADAGLVRFDQPHRLRGGLAKIPSGRIEDPNVAFFVSRNPRYADGDELVCLTELSPENLTAAGRRATRSLARW